jgi:Druantia protein DruA
MSQNDWIQIWKLDGFGKSSVKAIKSYIDALSLTSSFSNVEDRIDAVEKERREAITELKSDLDRDQALESCGIYIFADLIEIGWQLRTKKIVVEGIRPVVSTGEDERNRRKSALLARRLEQLGEPAVREFVKNAEQVRFTTGLPSSIFSVMRDGRELLKSFDEFVETGSNGSFIQPFIQVAESGKLCDKCGIDLSEIWRYFRHTWAQPYGSVPGRSMPILIRDAAVSSHPVIGIASLGSAAVQLTDRDKDIGWDDESVFQRLAELSSKKRNQWIHESLSSCFNELYMEDFIEEGILPLDLKNIQNVDAVIELLTQESVISRNDHKIDRSEHVKKSESYSQDLEYWLGEAKSPLFRSKRAKEIASLIKAGNDLQHLCDCNDNKKVDMILKQPIVRKAVKAISRRIRSRSIGTSIADLMICGAVPPYNEIIGGKLVALLSISPEAIRLFKDKYDGAVSVIASSMAGHSITRSSELLYVSTTSLFGVRPCQYDRAKMPAEVVGGTYGSRYGFKLISDTRGYGSMHFGKRTYSALRFLEQQVHGSQNVHHRFGEGASPRMRGLRDGLAVAGFDATELLQHEQRRILYSAKIASNTGEYLSGFHSKPHYLYDRRKQKNSTSSISDWWFYRWAMPRLQRQDVLDRIKSHTLIHPITHGGRVVMPLEDKYQYHLY